MTKHFAWLDMYGLSAETGQREHLTVFIDVDKTIRQVVFPRDFIPEFVVDQVELHFLENDKQVSVSTDEKAEVMPNTLDAL